MEAASLTSRHRSAWQQPPSPRRKPASAALNTTWRLKPPAGTSGHTHTHKDGEREKKKEVALMWLMCASSPGAHPENGSQAPSCHVLLEAPNSETRSDEMRKGCFRQFRMRTNC